jgi:two-component system, OmpR family, response regulator QseB
MRILLVEDDDRIAKPLGEGLKNEHHIVEIASDGLVGWEYAQSSEYDLILLDLMLPKLDGIELCKCDSFSGESR